MVLLILQKATFQRSTVGSSSLGFQPKSNFETPDAIRVVAIQLEEIRRPKLAINSRTLTSFIHWKAYWPFPPVTTHHRATLGLGYAIAATGFWAELQLPTCFQALWSWYIHKWVLSWGRMSACWINDVPYWKIETFWPNYDISPIPFPLLNHHLGEVVWSTWMIT